MTDDNGQQTITLHDIDVGVTRKGSGPPLVMLHGGGGPVTAMPFADRLAERFEVIAPTHPGFGHLLMMGQAGFLTYDETINSMTLFAKEVYPRLKELTAGYDAGAMKELRASLPDKELADLGLFASEFVR